MSYFYAKAKEEAVEASGLDPARPPRDEVEATVDERGSGTPGPSRSHARRPS